MKGVKFLQKSVNTVQVAREKYNVHVYAVVGDNAANMAKMGKILYQYHPILAIATVKIY